MKNIIGVILMVLATATLISLGAWQVKRLNWKTNIISQLGALYAQDAAENNLAFDDIKIDDAELPILYGSIQGRFDYSKEILVGPRPFDGAVGYNVVTPLLMSNGAVLVNRGFVQADSKSDALASHKQGKVLINGLLRAPDWNSFTPKNSPEDNIWSRFDIEQIATFQKISNVAPLMMYAETASKDFSPLKMQSKKWMPRNKHLQYAIFWFGMVFVLWGVFGSYILSKRKK